jgi:hypothetical protein
MHVKAQDHDLPYLIANELICCRLAAALGLPVLPGEVANHADGRKCWVTPQVSHGGVAVPPPKGDDVLAAHASTIAGTVVFDCWILNEDRNEDNFLFHDSLGMWLIDHEGALAGADGGRFETFSRKTDMPLGWHGFEGAALPEEAVKYWRWRVKSVSDRAIDLAIDEANARGLLPKAKGAVISKLLRDRKEQIDRLVGDFLKMANTGTDEDDPEDTLFTTL